MPRDDKTDAEPPRNDPRASDPKALPAVAAKAAQIRAATANLTVDPARSGAGFTTDADRPTDADQDKGDPRKPADVQTTTPGTTDDKKPEKPAEGAGSVPGKAKTLEELKAEIEQLQAENRRLAEPKPPAAPTPEPPAPAPSPANGAGTSVTLHVAGQPVPVDEYYELPYRVEKPDKNGTHARIVVHPGPDRRLDKIVRYNLLEGVGLHVRTTMARLADGPDGSRVAHPIDGRPPLPFKPGTAGGFGIPKPSAT